MVILAPWTHRINSLIWNFHLEKAVRQSAIGNRFETICQCHTFSTTKQSYHSWQPPLFHAFTRETGSSHLNILQMKIKPNSFHNFIFVAMTLFRFHTPAGPVPQISHKVLLPHHLDDQSIVTDLTHFTVRVVDWVVFNPCKMLRLSARKYAKPLVRLCWLKCPCQKACKSLPADQQGPSQTRGVAPWCTVATFLLRLRHSLTNTTHRYEAS